MKLLPEVIDSFRGEYWFLSNMANAPLVYDDIPYLNSKSAYQASKCYHPDQRYEFINLSGSDAKLKGQRVMLRDNWGPMRYQIMYDVVLVKFQWNPRLARLLRETRDAGTSS